MREQVEGTGGSAHGAGRDSQVARGSRKGPMAHEQLDPSYVSTRFQQVRGERVPQGMRRDGLLDAAALPCPVACLPDRVSGDRVSGDVTGKKPVAGMSVVPVRSQDLEQARGQHYIAILTVLALIHADDHALTVDVDGLQVRNF